MSPRSIFSKWLFHTFSTEGCTFKTFSWFGFDLFLTNLTFRGRNNKRLSIFVCLCLCSQESSPSSAICRWLTATAKGSKDRQCRVTRAVVNRFGHASIAATDIVTCQLHAAALCLRISCQPGERPEVEKRHLLLPADDYGFQHAADWSLGWAEHALLASGDQLWWDILGRMKEEEKFWLEPELNLSGWRHIPQQDVFDPFSTSHNEALMTRLKHQKQHLAFLLCLLHKL